MGGFFKALKENSSNFLAGHGAWGLIDRACCLLAEWGLRLKGAGGEQG